MAHKHKVRPLRYYFTQNISGKIFTNMILPKKNRYFNYSRVDIDKRRRVTTWRQSAAREPQLTHPTRPLAGLEFKLWYLFSSLNFPLLWLYCKNFLFSNEKFGLITKCFPRLFHDTDLWRRDAWTVKSGSHPAEVSVSFPSAMSVKKATISGNLLLAWFNFETLLEVISAILTDQTLSVEQRNRLQAQLLRILRVLRAFPS